MTKLSLFSLGKAELMATPKGWVGGSHCVPVKTFLVTSLGFSR